MVEERSVDLKAFAAVLHAKTFDEVPLVEEEDAPFSLGFNLAGDPLFLRRNPPIGVDDEDADIGALKGALRAGRRRISPRHRALRSFCGSQPCR